VFQGGAGTGKTDVGAWWMDQHMTGPACDRRLPGGHKALIAGPTYGDAITTCWKLPAGISAHNDRVQLTSRKEGTVALWPTGAEALFCGLHSEQDTELLRARAANCCTWWIDDAVIARRLAAAIDLIALRARAGPRPHGIVTSTPKPTAGWRHLIHQPEVIVTRGSSFDNRYLSAAHKRVIERFKGTRLEAQEVHGVLLDDFEGALWNRQRLDQYRRPAMGEPEQIVHDLGLTRIAVGIDPSTWDPDIGAGRCQPARQRRAMGPSRHRRLPPLARVVHRAGDERGRHHRPVDLPAHRPERGGLHRQEREARRPRRDGEASPSRADGGAL